LPGCHAPTPGLRGLSPRADSFVEVGG
jgi:hypothetical protein